MTNNFAAVTGSYSYTGFEELLERLLAENKTTGTNQSDAYIHYTKMSLQRLTRWDKTLILDEAFSEKARTVQPQIWWLITEGWCGDGAQTMPVMEKIAQASAGNIALRIILRDEHPAVMDQYLTNGSHSIPKLVAQDRDGNDLFTWGPRPTPVQKMMMDWKANPTTKSWEDIEKDMHLWYAQDKGKTTMAELMQLMQ